MRVLLNFALLVIAYAFALHATGDWYKAFMLLGVSLTLRHLENKEEE